MIKSIVTDLNDRYNLQIYIVYTQLTQCYYNMASKLW